MNDSMQNPNAATQNAMYKAQTQRNILRAQRLHSCMIRTGVDPRVQIRCGEAVCIGTEWSCLSSAVRDDLLLDEQPSRAQVLPSVVNMSKKNEVDGYICRINTKTLPLDGMLNEYGGIANLIKTKGA